MATPFIMRPMTPEDWPDVCEVYRLGIETGLATFEQRCPTYESWDENHLHACRIVASDGNRIAGWAALSAVSRRAVYRGVAELSIYLHPDYKGRGLGRLLLEQLISDSEDSGFWTLQATILAENAVSVALHGRCGFRTVGHRERIAQNSAGQWCDTILMERRSPSL